MGRAKLDSFWVSILYATFANDLRVSDLAVAADIEKLAAKLNRQDYPRLRTITLYKAMFKDLPEDVKAEYREIHWPESMEEELLPWASSRAVAELLDWADRYDLPRPPVSLCRWFWKISSEVMPEASIERRLAVAVTVASHREAGKPLPEGFEKALLPGSVNRDLEPLDRIIMRVVTGGPSAHWITYLYTSNEAAKSALQASLSSQEKFEKINA